MVLHKSPSVARRPGFAVRLASNTPKPNPPEPKTPIRLACDEAFCHEHEYDRDGFAQEEYSDDSINVNCVSSWNETGRPGELGIAITFHNGWVFLSDGRSHCPGGQAGLERLALRLREVNCGSSLRAPARHADSGCLAARAPKPMVEN